MSTEGRLACVGLNQWCFYGLPGYKIGSKSKFRVDSVIRKDVIMTFILLKG